MLNTARRLRHALHTGGCLIYLDLKSAHYQAGDAANPEEPKPLARALLLFLLRCVTQNSITRQDLILGEYGKPALPAHFNLAFNLSHTSRGIVIALTRQGEIGVDIEDTVVRLRRGMDIAKRFFTAAEFSFLRQLAPAQAGEMLQLLWTLKESYIKATGRGLSVPLNSFEFHFSGEDELTFYNHKPAASDTPWFFTSWQPQIEQHVSLCLTQRQPVRVFQAIRINKDDFIISTAQLNMIRKSSLYDIS